MAAGAKAGWARAALGQEGPWSCLHPTHCRGEMRTRPPRHARAALTARITWNAALCFAHTWAVETAQCTAP
eukprot:3657296-Lingulodinium_polyedra.AAC.1